MRLSLLALFIALSFDARADVRSNFGAELKAWVDNDVPRLSRTLVAADYPVRVKNIFLLAIEPQLAFFGSAGPALEVIKSDLDKDGSDYAELSVAEARALQDHAIRTQQQLIKISEDRARYALGMSRLRGENLEPAFYAAGAYNVGIGNILASYTNIGNQSKQSFRGRYPSIYVTTVTDANGNKVDVSTEAGGTVGMGITVGKALAAQFGASASAYVSSAVTFYAIWRLIDESNNFKHQQRLFEDALSDFPSRTMPVEEQFQLFREQWGIAQKEFAPLIDEIEKTDKVLDERLKTLIAWNTSRLALSRVAISSAKLQEALSNDTLLPADRRIFDAVRNQAVGSELSQLAGYVATLESRLKWACRDSRWLSLAEEYVLSANELGFVAQRVSSTIAFAPIHSRSTPVAERYADVLAGSRSLLEKVSSEPCPSSDIQDILMRIGDADQVPQRPTQMAINAFGQEATREAVVVMSGARRTTRQAFAGEMHYCYTNRSGYGCGDSGSGFWERFPQEPGNPMNSIGGSAGYGGYSDSQPSASEVVAAATTQIEAAAKRLKEEYASFAAHLPEWRSRNLATSALMLEENTDRLTNEQFSGERFRQMNRAMLGSAQAKIVAFLNGSLNSASIEALHRDANVSSIANAPFPPALQRNLGPALPALGLIPSVARATSAERARQELEFAAIGERVAKAELEGKVDPVFANSEAFFRTREVARMCLRMADDLVAERPLMSPRHAARVDSAVSAALSAARAARYYSWGYSSPPILQRIDVVDWEEMRSHITDTVSEFLTCNKEYGNQREMMETPCNIHVGTALNRLYGVTDFGKDGQFKRANDIAAYVRSAQEWTLVGPGNDQTALDDAGMLASKGRAVITVFANPNGPGHVNLVLPGIPVDKATFRPDYWGELRLPRVANFHWCTQEDKCDVTTDDLTFVDDTLDRAYKRVNPRYILIYVRDRP